MYKVIIWGTGKVYNRYLNCLKMQELMGNLYVCGITDKEKIYNWLDGYRYVEHEQINVKDVDYVIIAAEYYYEEIVNEAEKIGFDREHIFPIRIFSIPCFDFNEYVKLVHSHISIFANTCWGGVTYNSLAMKFYSPLINMFESNEDYLKLVSAPKYYFDLNLEFDRWEYKPNGEAYPVCRLDDIYLYFNHYKTMDEVENKWYDRVGRINYSNLFIMMVTEDKSMLETFSKLPCKKKICFVPFESSYQCACTLSFADKRSDPFWKIVNTIPEGMYHDYDVISLLNSGKVDHKRINTPNYE